jgi:hypothetical protein
MILNRLLIVSVAASLALVGAACGKGSSKSNLSVSTRSAAAAPATAGSLVLKNGIVLNEIRIAVVKVALESGQEAGDAPDASSSAPAGVRAAEQGGGDGAEDAENEGDEVKVGPCLIDLTGDKLGAGNDALAPVCAADIPSGTYHELEVHIGPVAASAAGGVAGLAALEGNSVVVDGTFNGTAFSFRSMLHVRQEIETTITVSASSNVTISVDPGGWFTAQGGGVLDPTLAANQQAIEDNIRASIRSFEDDDRDGQEDGDHRM